jgi:hypothetical protein
MSNYQDELLANYEALREQRSWSPAQMADHLEPIDPSLASAYREAYPSKREAAAARKDAADSAKDAPKNRTAPAKPSTAAKK